MIVKNSINKHTVKKMAMMSDDDDECNVKIEFTSVDCADPLLIEDVKPVACRGCLAASRPLQPLERALATLYEQLTGTPVSQSDIYPKFVCSYCRALLLKFAGFRRKCITSQETLLHLQSGGIPITKELLNSGVAGSPYPHLQQTLLQMITFNPNKLPTQDHGLVNQNTTDKNQKITFNFVENNVLEDFLQFHGNNQPTVNNLCIDPKVEDDNVIELLDSVSDDEVSDLPDCLLGMNSDIYEKDSTKPFKDDLTISKAKSDKSQNTVNYEGAKSIEYEHCYSKKTTCVTNDTQPLIEKLKVKAKANKAINRENYEDTTVIGSSDQDDSVDSTMGSDADLSDFTNDVTDMELSLTDNNCEQDAPAASVNIDMARKVKDNLKSPQNINKLKLAHTMGQNIPKNTSCGQRFNLKQVREFIKKVKHDRNIVQIMKSERKSELDTHCNKFTSSSELRQENLKTKISKKYNVTVTELTRDEQIKQFMERKNSPRYQNARYKCELCYTGFPFEDRYKIHMTIHEPKEGKKDFICDICNVRYTTKRHHQSRKHEHNYVCNECGYVSNNPQKAAIHYKSHKGTKYSCKICGKAFDRPTSVYGHMHLTHGGSVPCSICGEKFIGQKGLQWHMNQFHKEAVGAVCGECGVQFHSHSALRRHRAQAGSCDHTHRPCAECGETFLSNEDLRQHKKKAHQRKRRNACEMCGRQYENRSKYYSHIKHGCKDARKLFPRSSASKSSVLQLPQEFICEVCGVVKHSRLQFVVHMNTHIKPFQCDYCQRRFANKTSLKEHIITHMTILRQRKTYKCRHCPTKLTNPSNRWRHEKNVHTNQPLSCEYCGRTYLHKESLQVHINHLHLGKPWPKRTRSRRKYLDS